MTTTPPAVTQLLKAVWLDLEHPQSVVYFVLNPDNAQVKIGRTRDLSTRLATLRTALPDLMLLGWFPGGARAEADLHASFAADRTRGEWFHLTPSLAQTILDLKEAS